MEGEYPVLLDTFLNDSEQRVQQLQHALAEQAAGLPALGLAAHSFKGSSGNLGAVHLAELCRQLEERAQQNLLAGAAELVRKIEIEFVTVRRLFSAERQRFCE
ncbi:Hpt domain-containing protein [Pseudomonas sp. NA-150]|uniref:Hpt domain-containing protein n=1 Tax=Pseudomonas sp. NA-150 TaxID=3367525 RepID=UPI0037CAEBF3